MKNLSNEVVFEKLLKYGLFPEKLLKIFTSEDFGKWAIKNSIEKYQNPPFSYITFRLTRNNNAPRILSIPHPAPYFRLCNEIKTNWKQITAGFGDIEDYERRSMITPKPNNLNKRLVSMLSYDRRLDEKFLILDKSFKAKYFVQVDIANCYPSIYSHSICWALVDKVTAKEKAKDNSLWYNKLDKAIRNLQRNETVGIPIGPDTSSLISEIVLSKIDKNLSKFKYLRFIDDYKCYCESKEEAERFINELSKELEYFNLRLNQKKTQILALPKTAEEDWINELKLFANTFLDDEKLSNKHINYLSQFFDLIIKLSIDFPDDSAVRYAVKVLSQKIITQNDVYAFLILSLSRICFIYPYFIDVFDDIFSRNPIPDKIRDSVTVEINSIMKEHLNYSRSDIALWGIYLCIKNNLEIEKFEQYSDKLIKNRDCLPTLLCYYYAKKNELSIKKYLQLIIDIKKDLLEDEWWIFIYTLLKEYKNKPAFKDIKYRDFYLDLVQQDISFVTNSIDGNSSEDIFPFENFNF